MKIRTPTASKQYLGLQTRDTLLKIVKQHNITGVSRMNISDLRIFMHSKKVREYDSKYTEPSADLRPPQKQVKVSDLKKEIAESYEKLHKAKDKTVNYVKKVVKLKKTVKGHLGDIGFYKEHIRLGDEITQSTDDYVRELEQQTKFLTKVIHDNNLT